MDMKRNGLEDLKNLPDSAAQVTQAHTAEKEEEKVQH